ncbi:transcription factor e(y)2-domain-containing protein [Halteromyces radiatus]|uniref:transcription factor e(y)2-domain-containing protein n=1 Tax=Halteromyces radiatus TaxID=101107 RepID=UPI00221F3876|nr:transcription factor e(y)2-domain-containing protein [Halteromyces radiatus]KAI8096691.1 transcription factor e(y)2-domain-containing protein [Halteromyces radiatus]
MSADDNLMTALNQYFVSSGEKQRLLTLLKARLAETSWNDSYYAHCRDTMQDHKNNFTMDELIQETSDYGKSTINESIKKELLVLIKKFLTDTVSTATTTD